MKPLPLTTPPASEPDRLEGVVQVFDPAMCCPTGLCGPGVDPALLTLARDLRWLESKGVSVERFGLSQEPGAFAGNPRVAGLLQAFGDAALPVTLVKGTILLHGRYPTREELVVGLGSSPSDSAKSKVCCTPGSGCC
ncbi:MAG TPA: arsenite efflux transporter metallochaperone ArsD [Gemmatimonadales bacterium]|nr:arsenite efflux transporter metallochaperone ArsD [Gemmatimonadales bacterium]